MQELDQSRGWVSLTEIRNVYVELLRNLDKYLLPLGTPGRAEVMKAIETTQYDLTSRAKRNYQEYMKWETPHPKPTAPSPDSREAYIARRSAMKNA